ncbi:MAG TPA: hypothetical protein VG871_17260 [Vicinamibacterales bacterium]|nr:hypothetical protein [Vicinamibacterales bacterium]
MGQGRLTGVVLAAGILHAIPASAQTVKLPDLLSRTTAYVEQFVQQFSSVVAEERYLQQSEGAPHVVGSGFSASFVPSTPVRRELVSDYLLVRAPDSSTWYAFRDVFSVDGRDVRDRQERLTALFLQPESFAISQAQQIALESARYNLQPLRTVNHPLQALTLLQRVFRERFSFSLRGADRKVGPDVVAMAYRERKRPTVLRTPDNHDLPASGRVWVEASTGRIVRTELVVGGSDSVTTSFARDDALQIDVPAEMREAYPVGDSSVTGVATYSRFRRFEVTTEQQLTPR